VVRVGGIGAADEGVGHGIPPVRGGGAGRGRVDERVAAGGHVASRAGSTANARAGAPVPRARLIGAAQNHAPCTGNRSSRVSASTKQTPCASAATWTGAPSWHEP